LEDVVGITGKASSGNDMAFMTWGRLFDPVDDAEFLDIIELHSSMFAGGPARNLKVCNSLLEVSKYEYFYEALLHYAWNKIPFGENWNEWRSARREALIKSGADIYFLGPLLEEA